DRFRSLSDACFLRRHHVVQRTPKQSFRARTNPIRSTVNGGTRPLISIMDANLVTALAGVLGLVSGASAAIATTWISQQSQMVRGRAKWEAKTLLIERPLVFKPSTDEKN